MKVLSLSGYDFKLCLFSLEGKPLYETYFFNFSPFGAIGTIFGFSFDKFILERSSAFRDIFLGLRSF